MQEKHNSTTIPKWQKDIVRERIKNSNDDDYVSWKIAKKTLNHIYKIIKTD